MKTETLLRGLNPVQRQAVVYQGGPLLILAGAGSGKTRVLTYRAAWLVASGQVKPNQLLLLTFTNKAAEEMKTRLKKLLGEKQKKSPFAGTFHSFCAMVLRKEGKKIGLAPSFVIFDEDDQKAVVKEILSQMGIEEKQIKPALVQAVIEHAKNDLLDPGTFLDTAATPSQQLLGEIYRRYQERLQKFNAVDFADLLFFTVRLFQEKNEVLRKYQEQYRAILVDEYQDTNHSQYILTKLLAQRYQHLTVVGDASQAIYAWRGADYRNLLSLTRDFPQIKTINLEINYRSTQNILDAAFGVISKNETHPILKLKTENGQGEKIVIFRGRSEGEEAEFVFQETKRLIEEGIKPEEIAVLYRTNAQSRIIEEVFLRHGLPYILIGGIRFYDRAEVKDVLSLLRVFHNSNDLVSWQRIEKNFGKRRMEKVKKFLEENKKKRWASKEVMERILAASGYLEKFSPDDEDDARRLENIKELLSVAEKFPHLGEFLENVALVQQEYFAQEKEKKQWRHQAVKLMTLHASKGLEFTVVFLVGMEEGLLPHSRSLENPEGVEEERRLCYVGMTRAKKKLYLTFATQRLYFGKTSFNEPSRFLEDIPPHLVEFRGEEEIDWEEGWDLEEEW